MKINSGVCCCDLYKKTFQEMYNENPDELLPELNPSGSFDSLRYWDATLFPPQYVYRLTGNGTITLAQEATSHSFRLTFGFKLTALNQRLIVTIGDATLTLKLEQGKDEWPYVDKLTLSLSDGGTEKPDPYLEVFTNQGVWTIDDRYMDSIPWRVNEASSFDLCVWSEPDDENYRTVVLTLTNTNHEIALHTLSWDKIDRTGNVISISLDGGTIYQGITLQRADYLDEGEDDIPEAGWQ